MGEEVPEYGRVSSLEGWVAALVAVGRRPSPWGPVHPWAWRREQAMSSGPPLRKARPHP